MWRTVISSTIPEIPRLLMFTFSPRLKGRDQLSITPLTTSAKTCWAAKPTMATSSEELVNRVALRVLVVLNRPLAQINAMMVRMALEMLRRNLIWICSLRFKIMLNVLFSTSMPTNQSAKIIASLIKIISKIFFLSH